MDMDPILGLSGHKAQWSVGPIVQKLPRLGQFLVDIEGVQGSRVAHGEGSPVCLQRPSVCRKERSTSVIGSDPITRLTAEMVTVARLSVITTESVSRPD
jgi:hypothetical protein